MSAMGPNRDDGEDDADDANCDPDRLCERVARVVVVPGVNLNFCHQKTPRRWTSASRILLEVPRGLFEQQHGFLQCHPDAPAEWYPDCEPGCRNEPARGCFSGTGQ